MLLAPPDPETRPRRWEPQERALWARKLYVDLFAFRKFPCYT